MGRSLLIDAIGTVIEIDGSGLTGEGWAAVKRAWSGATLSAGSESGPSATVAAHGTVPTSAMLASLSIDVTLAALEQRAGEAILLHAAGLATSAGGVVALVGPSGRGKTTASRVLGRNFGYVSDESVGIEEDGTVRPYRKPLSIIEGVSHSKVQRSPRELGLRPLEDVPLRLAALVLLERDAVARVPRVEQVDLAEGLVGLAEQASYLGRLPYPLATLLSHIAAAGGVHRLVYREAETLVPVVTQLVERTPNVRRPPGAGKPDDFAAVSMPSAELAAVAAGATYRRVPVIDAQPLDGQRLALLIQHSERSTKVVVLDGIAPAIWEAAEHAATIDALVATTVARHGEPPGADAATVVAASVEKMVDEGILRADAR